LSEIPEFSKWNPPRVDELKQIEWTAMAGFDQFGGSWEAWLNTVKPAQGLRSLVGLQWHDCVVMMAQRDQIV
jgi:hypothetical protein